MPATAERYEDDLTFCGALTRDLRDFLAARGGELGDLAAERRAPYDLPRAYRRLRPRQDAGDSIDAEAAALARFRDQARRLAKRDPDIAAIVAAYEESGGETDPEMVAVVADLDADRYAVAMSRLAVLMGDLFGA